MPKLTERQMGRLVCGNDLMEVLQTVKDNKPNDRSEEDRYWAIVVTDLEKLAAFFRIYILPYNEEVTNDGQ